MADWLTAGDLSILRGKSGGREGCRDLLCGDLI